MKKLILIAILVAIGWQGYAKYQGQRVASANTLDLTEPIHPRSPLAETIPSQQFKCDGRTHCSQMTSCQEAKFFLKNCPGVKMDGNNDGIPCEKQWCN